MTRRFTLFTLAAIAAALFAAQGASASVTIGSDLSRAPFEWSVCASKCTWTQTALAGRTALAPTDGVLVRWRVSANGASGPIAIRVMRPGAASNLTGVATGPTVATTAAGISVFPARIPIRAGDALGLDFDSTNTAGMKPSSGDPATVALYHAPALLDGVTAAATVLNTGTELLLNGDIEPDADQDGFGDESQDSCPRIAGTVNGCASAVLGFTVKSSKRQSVRRLSALVSLDRAGSLIARPVVTFKSRGKRITIKGKLTRATLTPSTEVKVSLSFTKAQRAKLVAQLKMGRKLNAQFRFVARDTGESSINKNQTVRLKR